MISKKKVRLLLLSTLVSLACTTKVSEWVMLNAPPDAYTLVYNHYAPLSDSEISQIGMMEKSSSGANLSVHTRKIQGSGTPFFSVYYDGRLVERFQNTIDYKNLVTSPERKKIASYLMDGNLCVMVFLRSGDPMKDERALRIVREAVASSPFSEIIPVVDLNRIESSEKMLVSMLLNAEDDLKYISEPMLFGIFGRFRALEPLLAKGISKENIGLMIDFLTADCSCLIKDDLPGINILFEGNWENPDSAKVNRIIDANPELQHN